MQGGIGESTLSKCYPFGRDKTQAGAQKTEQAISSPLVTKFCFETRSVLGHEKDTGTYQEGNTI